MKNTHLRRVAIAAFAILALFIAGCGGNADKGNSKKVYRTIEDFNGGTMAVGTGSAQEAILEKEHPGITLMRMESESDMIQALHSKLCDAVISDGHILKFYIQSHKDLTMMDFTLNSFPMGAAFAKGSDLRVPFDEFIKKIKEDGTYDQMYDRWINNALTSKLPEFEFDNSKEPIRIATSSASPPMAFIQDGELVGFEVELGMRFGEYMGRPVVWSDMYFSGIIPSLVGGTQDMAMSGISITEERAKSIDFSTNYFNCEVQLCIRKENSPQQEGTITSLVGTSAENSENYAGDGSVGQKEKVGLLESVKRSFYRNIVEEDRYKMILSGLKLTTFISIMAGIIGTLLGALVCWMKMHRNIALRAFANAYISVMRGTPVLVFLMLMFYVVLAGTSLSAVWVSIITFAMNFSAYAAEMFRSSIEGIDKGQTEAGLSLGYTPARTFIKFILPQAFAKVLPVYKGEIISLVKTTSIVGYIAVQDLTKVGDIIRSRTFDAFFPLIMVAILYFVLAWIFATALDLVGPKKK